MRPVQVRRCAGALVRPRIDARDPQHKTRPNRSCVSASALQCWLNDIPQQCGRQHSVSA